MSSILRSSAVLSVCLLLACTPSTTTTSPPAAGTGANPSGTGPTTIASGDTTAAATSVTGTATDGSSSPPEIKPSDCPPRCSESGAWVGCTLEKPRGKNCGGCAPKCKSKGTAEEGWYDCSGVFIVTAKCG